MALKPRYDVGKENAHHRRVVRTIHRRAVLVGCTPESSSSLTRQSNHDSQRCLADYVACSSFHHGANVTKTEAGNSIIRSSIWLNISILRQSSLKIGIHALAE